MEVLPGILEKDWTGIERKIELVKSFTRTIHIDILDGKFADNTTFLDPTPFKKYTSDIFFELHMMVEEPIQYLKPFADAGFKRFLGHVEKMSDQAKFVAQGQLIGEVGLVIDGPSTVDAIKVPLDSLDVVLIMTIKAGFSGQAFIQDHLDKVRLIRTKSSLIPIEIDGGVTDQTILSARSAGANRFVVTSAIFGKDDPHKAFFSLSEAVNKI